MAKPLDGVRVLEFANFIAGPFGGMLLADMGADVIKIEAPSGDMARAIPPIIDGESASFAHINRNKRSLVLDLKKPEGRDIVYELAKTADVFLENNRPGAMERLGLGADRIREINPKIVYTSVSGFGQTGPNKNRAGVNLIIEAMAGTLSVIGDPGTMPHRPGLQTADILGAMFGVYATLSGLVGAGRTGEGRVSDVALVEASVASAVWETAEYLSTGTVPVQIGHFHRASAPYQLFATNDGRYLAIGVPNNTHFERLMTLLGLEEHLTDPRYSSYSARKANEEALVPLVADAVAKWNSADLEGALMEAGVPCGPMQDYAETLGDAHAEARRLVVETDHPVLGHMKAVRNPVLMDHDGPAIDRAAPLLGEHSREVLESIGMSGAQIAALIDAGVTLDGSARAEAAE